MKFAEIFSSQAYWAALIVGALALLLMLVRPMERRVGRRVLALAALLAGTLAAGEVWVGSGHPRMGDALVDVATVGLGITLLRTCAVLCFRGLLPLVGIPAPRILADVTSALLYLLWGYVWLRMTGVDLTSVVTTSAVITAVIAFSMQDTLGNVLGGVALQLDNSITVGDWVRVDDVSGHVVDIRWRYTAIETRNRETVFVPNSYLMKSRFVVLGSRNDESLRWRRWVWINVELDTPPARVCEVLESAVVDAHIPHVASSPEPSAVLMDFIDGTGRYALRYWLDDPQVDDPTDSRVRTHIVAALARNGIRVAVPRAQHTIIKDNEARRAADQAEELRRRRDALKHVDIFATLSETELDTLATHLVHAPFAAGDTVTRQGAIAHWLYIILSGTAEVSVSGPSGSKPVATLQPGSVFGEMGMMTGEPRQATITALSDVDCYRLDKAGFEIILRARPDLSREISHVLAMRQTALRQAIAAVSAPLPATQPSDLVEKIRRFFGLGEGTGSP
ncbi:MAG: mechanosensitive ion channel family protein [Burkholderiales bacterium]